MANAEIAVKDFTDVNGRLVACHSPEAAIYDENNIPLSTKLKSMDVSAITENLSSATSQISSLTEACSARIASEGSSYSDSITDIYDVLYPLTVEFGVFLDTGKTFCELNYRVTCKDKDDREYKDVVPTDVVLKKRVNETGDWSDNMFDWGLEGPTSSTGATASTITGAIEEYDLTVTKDGKADFHELKKLYLCAYGASTAQTMTSEVFDTLSLVQAKGLKAMPSVTTTEGSYIWIVVPSALSISRVVCSGFDIPMVESTYSRTEAEETYYLGEYKAYRSSRALTATTWQLMLN